MAFLATRFLSFDIFLHNLILSILMCIIALSRVLGLISAQLDIFISQGKFQYHSTGTWDYFLVVTVQK